MMFEIILHFQGSDTVQGVEKEDPEPFDAKKHLAVSSSATNCHRNTSSCRFIWPQAIILLGDLNHILLK